MYLNLLNRVKPNQQKLKRHENFSPLLIFDLPTLIGKLKQSHNWAKGELNATILLKRPDKQVVLTALHKGTEISSFQSNDSITFQIIEGKLKFHTRKRSVILDKGQLLTLHENINYRLISGEDTVFLLTIANGALSKSAEN
jgi:quercetin dioxygenase-like cupin family protein